MGDIGKLFPDTDPKYEGADSLRLLKLVVGKLSCAGYSVGNVDVTVIAEEPTLAPYITKIRLNLARVLEVDVGAVSVKATTEEGLGLAGDGIAAHAVCIIESK
jgi:2-C-methyl-D-erythritol 2,4-cyclodiphosphate synthase